MVFLRMWFELLVRMLTLGSLIKQLLRRSKSEEHARTIRSRPFLGLGNKKNQFLFL